MIKKRVDVSDKYIKWLSELSKTSGSVAGGKGANLAEMFNSGFPVPPAFCVTAQSFDFFLQNSALKHKIQEIINQTNVDDTTELEDNSKAIREIIINAEMPTEMENEILEAYEILSTDQELKKAEQHFSVSKGALDILKNSKEPVFVAVRSSATTEDLSTASFAGQQETYTNIKGNKNLIEAIKKCFASLYTGRAVYYRKKKGFKESEALLSVVVQKMINSDKSGVIFTKNPVNNENEIVIEAVFGLGEGIVSGKIKPDNYHVSNELEILTKKIADKNTAIVREASGTEKTVRLTEEKSKQQVLSDFEIKNLADIALKLQEHYKKPQDIEFALESGRIYIVQTRPITTLGKNTQKSNIKLGDNFILSGLAASPGIASGTVRIVNTLEDLSKIKNGDVLVTKMTNPDMVVAMQRCSAIVTDEGGATAHAAIVSREMGIPCVVGTEKATEILKEESLITVDGTNGKVYEGKITENNQKKEILPMVKGTKTKIKVMVDIPDFAERAAKSEAESVGLLRLEGIIASSGKHPLYFSTNNKIEDYVKLIQEGIEKISLHFKEVWIRTSDIRSDEYRHLEGSIAEVEVNPMLGFHGIRFSLKNLPIFEAELEAIKRVAEKYPEKKFGIMFPQVILESEMSEAYKIFKKYERKNIVIGAMIETPAAVQIIRGICKYAKFVSFGTNDLTQYTLAIDRGNAECQYLYNEMHPAILSQIKRVIEIAHEYHVQTSICGQAGSKKEMVEFLVRNNIDSISVNADVAEEVSQLVKQLEDERMQRNKNPVNQNSNMAKSKILPIDDFSEIKKKEDEKVKKIEEEKRKRLEEEKKEETTEEKVEEKKSEEFPEFEIGFDPFAEQK
jgi:pyruvate,water dikinase